LGKDQKGIYQFHNKKRTSLKTLVIIPTYNEEKNIGRVIDETLEVMSGDILVVDDNSMDRTRYIIKKYLTGGKVFMLERASKLGLGTAYIEGFKWGLRKDYDLFFEMDGDLSHDPKVIPHFIKTIEEGYNMVVGSRYLNKTINVVGWDFKRLLLSKFGNWYASTLLGLRQFTDLTSGYRCYTRKALEALGLDSIKSNGYAFQIEMVYSVRKTGFAIAEIPIIFYERSDGISKMNKRIVREAIFLPFKLKFKDLFQV
jgi:dolichol-phosphate mannosyltransferase